MEYMFSIVQILCPVICIVDRHSGFLTWDYTAGEQTRARASIQQLQQHKPAAELADVQLALQKVAT
jgi:hypothetical protein